MATSTDYRIQINNLKAQKEAFVKSVDQCITTLNDALASANTASSSVSGTSDTVLKAGLSPKAEELKTIISTAISSLESKKGAAVTGVDKEISRLSYLESQALAAEKESE